MMQQDGGKLLGFVSFRSQKTIIRYKDRLNALEGENKYINVYKVKMTQRQSQNRCTMHTICLIAFGSGMQCMTSIALDLSDTTFISVGAETTP